MRVVFGTRNNRDRHARLAWLCAPTHPLNLAVFRIATCWAWLMVLRLDESRFLSNWPDALMGPHSLWRVLGWPTIHDERIVTLAGSLAYVSLACATLGIAARPMLALLLLSGGYISMISQFAGSIHHFNHVVLATLLLIASPCDHALAPGASTRRAASLGARAASVHSDLAAPSLAYALPLRFMAIILMIAYFFAGLWKVVNLGSYWFTPTNFINQLHTKWHEFHSTQLPPRVDRVWILCVLAPAFTIAIELCWGMLVLVGRRGRMLAAIGATMFHAATWFFLRINFMHMALMQVVLVDWHALIRRMQSRRYQVAHTPGLSASRANIAIWPVTLVGTLLVAGMLMNGALRRNDWPLGCYPRFDERAHDRISVLEVRARWSNGTTRIYRENALHPFMRTSRARAVFERALRPSATFTRPQRLSALASVLQRVDARLAHAIQIDFVQCSESIRPPDVLAAAAPPPANARDQRDCVLLLSLPGL